MSNVETKRKKCELWVLNPQTRVLCELKRTAGLQLNFLTCITQILNLTSF